MTTGGTSDAYNVLRRMFEEGFATGATDVVDELCAPNLVEHQFGLAGAGQAAISHVKAAIRDVHAATAEGTATGPFFGPLSRLPVEITFIDIVRVIDGRIVEHWGVPDRFALLAQTGVLSRVAQAAANPPQDRGTAT